MPLHRQRLHHGWTWPRPPRIRWSSKSLNAGSRCLSALSLAPALFMPPAPCSSLISLSWFSSPLLYLRPPSTSRSRRLSFMVVTRLGRLELGETLLWPPENLDHLRVGWISRGTYETAWVTPGHDCLCSYHYGHGAPVRPQTNNAIWDGLLVCGAGSHHSYHLGVVRRMFQRV